MAAGPLADGLMAFACFQYVSEPVSWLQILLLMVLLAFACFQYVSEPVSWLQVLLLMVLWHLPAFSM
jgi:hypothetical protein